MTKRAYLIPFATLVALAVPGIAAAHDGTASGTCQGGVQWNYFHFDKTVTNSITVTIDGVIRWQDLDFKSSDAGTIATDRTVAHTWDVKVDAPGTQYDKHPSGSYAACETAPTTTSVPATTTTVTPTTVTATTLPSEPTTSVVAVDLPPVPSTTLTDVVVVTQEPELPATGIDPILATAAGVLVGIGILLVWAHRMGRMPR